MRRFFLFIFQGPRKPWQLAPVIVVFYSVSWVMLYSAGLLPHPWLWLVPWLLPLWWQYLRFIEVSQYTRLSRRAFDWTCPVCKYPLARLTNDFDPRTHRCPECGNVPQQVLDDAKAKLREAAKW